MLYWLLVAGCVLWLLYLVLSTYTRVPPGEVVFLNRHRFLNAGEWYFGIFYDALQFKERWEKQFTFEHPNVNLKAHVFLFIRREPALFSAEMPDAEPMLRAALVSWASSLTAPPTIEGARDALKSADLRLAGLNVSDAHITEFHPKFRPTPEPEKPKTEAEKFVLNVIANAHSLAELTEAKARLEAQYPDPDFQKWMERMFSAARQELMQFKKP